MPSLRKDCALRPAEHLVQARPLDALSSARTCPLIGLVGHSSSEIGGRLHVVAESREQQQVRARQEARERDIERYHAFFSRSAPDGLPSSAALSAFSAGTCFR